MGLRDLLENNTRLVMTVAVVVIVAGVSLTVMRTGTANRRGNPSQTIFFMDLDTGKLFAEPADTQPPIKAPSGGVGVRAYVYSCGSCEQGDRFVLFIEKLDDAARRATANPPKNPAEVAQYDAIMARGRHVAAAPESGSDVQWMLAASASGQAKITAWRNRCGGKMARVCRP